jgi:hypothetical protein
VPGAIELELGDAHADITDHDTYVQGVPHATFLRLREDDPVSFTEEHDGRGFWSITRYDDVLYVSRHTEQFSSAKGIRMEDMDDEETDARRTIMEMDPPAHSRYRRLVKGCGASRASTSCSAWRASSRCGCSAPCSASPTKTSTGSSTRATR